MQYSGQQQRGGNIAHNRNLKCKQLKVKTQLCQAAGLEGLIYPGHWEPGQRRTSRWTAPLWHMALECNTACDVVYRITSAVPDHQHPASSVGGAFYGVKLAASMGIQQEPRWPTIHVTPPLPKVEVVSIRSAEPSGVEGCHKDPRRTYKSLGCALCPLGFLSRLARFDGLSGSSEATSAHSKSGAWVLFHRAERSLN